MRPPRIPDRGERHRHRDHGTESPPHGSAAGPLIEVIEPTTLPALPSDDDQLEIHYAERIGAAWRKAVESIIEAGRILIEAKDALPHGRFLAMVKDRLGMSPDTAQRLMAIASDDWISNAAHARHLPPSWMTLYLITKIEVADRERLTEIGCIRPDMRRADIEEAARQLERERHPDEGESDPPPPKPSAPRAQSSIWNRAAAVDENVVTPPEPIEPELAPDEAHAVLLDLARFVAEHAVRSGNGKVIFLCVRGDDARVFERLLDQARAVLCAADHRHDAAAA